MPQNPNIIASKSSFPDVLLYDFTQEYFTYSNKTNYLPIFRLRGHSKEGKTITSNFFYLVKMLYRIWSLMESKFIW